MIEGSKTIDKFYRWWKIMQEIINEQIAQNMQEIDSEQVLMGVQRVEAQKGQKKVLDEMESIKDFDHV